MEQMRSVAIVWNELKLKLISIIYLHKVKKVCKFFLMFCALTFSLFMKNMLGLKLRNYEKIMKKCGIFNDAYE